MSDADELLALVQAARPGQLMVHLHLGRLETPPLVDRQAIRKVLREVGKKADAWRLFDMANGDLVLLLHGVDPATAEGACRMIAGWALAVTRIRGPGEAPLYRILALPEQTKAALTSLVTG